MKKKPSLSAASGLSVFLLLALFMVLAILTVVLGAGVYRAVVARSEESYDLRTTLSYVAGKVRAADSLGGVRVENSGEDSTLVLLEEIEGRTYETRIYYYDGALREIFVPAGAEFFPEDGQRIAKIEAFQIAKASENLLLLEAVAQGESYPLHVALRSGGEGM